jgi:hypothetical protein
VKKLRDNGFFSQRRDIVDGLQAAATPTTSTRSARRSPMFERNEIERTPVDGKLKYDWDASRQPVSA